jgi:hypothetical protein
MADAGVVVTGDPGHGGDKRLTDGFAYTREKCVARRDLGKWW